jgi:hypothetical protein
VWLHSSWRQLATEDSCPEAPVEPHHATCESGIDDVRSSRGPPTGTVRARDGVGSNLRSADLWHPLLHPALHDLHTISSMLETGFCDQMKSFYRCMIMWRAIRSRASLCGYRALHAEIGACSIFNLQPRWGLQIVHPQKFTNNNRNAFQIDLPEGQLWTESRYHSFWFWVCLIISRLNQTLTRC